MEKMRAGDIVMWMEESSRELGIVEDIRPSSVLIKRVCDDVSLFGENVIIPIEDLKIFNGKIEISNQLKK